MLKGQVALNSEMIDSDQSMQQLNIVIWER